MMGLNFFSSNFYTFYMNSVMYKMATNTFARYDTNEDSTITQDDFSGSNDAFNFMDTDADGEIGLSDIRNAFGLNSVSTPRYNIVEDMLKNSFVRQIQERDRDADNILTLDEYVGEEEDFNRIDANDDSKITADEMLQDYLSQNPDIARLISQIDTMNMLLDALTFLGKTDFHSYF